MHAADLQLFLHCNPFDDGMASADIYEAMNRAANVLPHLNARPCGCRC